MKPVSENEIGAAVRRLAAALALAALLLPAGCSSMPSSGDGGPAGPPDPASFPPVPVRAAAALEESVPIQLLAVGMAEASAVVAIKSRVAGELRRVHFAEGAWIGRGDLLFEIDPRPFEEALRRAEADVARSEALLRQAEASRARDHVQHQNLQADARRIEELARQGIAPTAQAEQMRAAEEAAGAAVRADEAAIESARANLESARAGVEQATLDLGYCRIVSPISGRTGNLLVHPGNLVKAGDDSPLVVIHQTSPIFVSFSVPERHLPDVLRAGARPLPVQGSVEGESRGVEGVLSVVDNAVDPETGMIRLKARFENRDRFLWPGRFVSVVLVLERQTATVVASQAVQAGQQGPFVYVIRPDQTVELRPVTLGPESGTRVILRQGVSAGEQVVLDGHLRLFPGARVQLVTDGEAPAADSRR